MTLDTNGSSEINSSSQNGRILKADVAQSLMNATDLINDAKQKAKEITDKAEQRALDIIANAQKNADGILPQIRDEEYNKAKENVLKDILGNQIHLHTQIQSVHNALIELVDTCLHKIINEMDSRFLIEQVVRKALNELHEKFGITLKIHPVQFDEVQAVLRDSGLYSPESSSNTPIYRIEASNQLNHNEFQIFTQNGTVDITIEKQIKVLIDELALAYSQGHSSL